MRGLTGWQLLYIVAFTTLLVHFGMRLSADPKPPAPAQPQIQQQR